MKWRTPVMRISLLAMESLWVYALGALLLALTVRGSAPSLPAAALVVFASFGISRALRSTDLAIGLVRLWGILLSFLLFYGIARVEFFGDWRFWDFTWADQLFYHTEATLRDKAAAVIGIPYLWLFWMRGLLRGQQYLGFESVVASFATGVVIVALVAALTGPLDMEGGVRFVAVPYIAVGLLTLGLAHAGRSEDEFGRSFTAGWLLAVAAAVVLIGAMAAGISALDRGTAAEGLRTAGEGAGWAASRVLYYATYPIIFAMEHALRLIGDLLEKAFDTQADPNRFNRQEEPPPQEEQERTALPGWLQFILRAIVAGTLIGAVIGLTALVFNRLRPRERPDELRESTYVEGRLANDLGNLLGSLIGRLRPGVRFGEQQEPVRRLYFEMLATAAERGIERERGETPLELVPRLEKTFASQTPGRITHLFDDTRYGALPAPPERVTVLREEWEETKRR